MWWTYELPSEQGQPQGSPLSYQMVMFGVQWCAYVLCTSILSLHAHERMGGTCAMDWCICTLCLTSIICVWQRVNIMHDIIVIGTIGDNMGFVVFDEWKLSDTSVISSTEATCQPEVMVNSMLMGSTKIHLPLISWVLFVLHLWGNTEYVLPVLSPYWEQVIQCHTEYTCNMHMQQQIL